MDILYTLREIKVHLHSPAKITLMLILHHIYLRMCAHGILCSGISNIALCYFLLLKNLCCRSMLDYIWLFSSTDFQCSHHMHFS